MRLKSVLTPGKLYSIERILREVRRIVRPINCFENRAGAERIIFAVFNRFNGIWENGAHLEITQNI